MELLLIEGHGVYVVKNEKVELLLIGGVSVFVFRNGKVEGHFLFRINKVFHIAWEGYTNGSHSSWKVRSIPYAGITVLCRL